jgi:hypothetical protein
MGCVPDYLRIPKRKQSAIHAQRITAINVPASMVGLLETKDPVLAVLAYFMDLYVCLHWPVIADPFMGHSDWVYRSSVLHRHRLGEPEYFSMSTMP